MLALVLFFLGHSQIVMKTGYWDSRIFGLAHVWSVILMNCYSFQPTSSTKPFISYAVLVKAAKVDILYIKMCVTF